MILVFAAFGKNFKVGPGDPMAMIRTDNRAAMPIPAWVGATIFSLFGLGLILYALRRFLL
jgi:hypothetical protein